MLGTSRPRAGGSRKRDALLVWGLKALHDGMKPKEVKATMKSMSRKTVAEIVRWAKAQSVKIDKEA